MWYQAYQHARYLSQHKRGHLVICAQLILVSSQSQRWASMLLRRWLAELLENAKTHFSESIFTNDGKHALTPEGMKILFTNNYLKCQELLVFTSVLMVSHSLDEHIYSIYMQYMTCENTHIHVNHIFAVACTDTNNQCSVDWRLANMNSIISCKVWK